MSREGRKDFLVAAIIDGDVYYAIDRILGKRKRDGTFQYRVKWTRSSTTDWVPEDALCRGSCELLFFYLF